MVLKKLDFKKKLNLRFCHKIVTVTIFPFLSSSILFHFAKWGHSWKKGTPTSLRDKIWWIEAFWLTFLVSYHLAVVNEDGIWIFLMILVAENRLYYDQFFILPFLLHGVRSTRHHWTWNLVVALKDVHEWCRRLYYGHCWTWS